MAAVGEAPTLFLRKATGLVKGWSKFDAFLYSFMSVNFVTLGLFFALSVLAFVPTGQVLPALLISGVFVTFLVITYAGLISVMPRAGGDYVWQSRVMGGGIAFVLAVTGWWFILWYWAPIYGNILNVEVLQPLAATFMDYILPTLAELPEIDSLMFEYPEPANPLGVKGAGNAGIICTHAAVANAVADALGPDVSPLVSLPLRASSVRALIRAAELGETPRR